MESYQKYLDPQTLAKLQGLELRARLIVEGYVSGVHRSPYHGFSIEFAEHREYAPGDDLRYVDWKVFGKTDKFYLKQYEEETNLVSHLVLDTTNIYGVRLLLPFSPSLFSKPRKPLAPCLYQALSLLRLGGLIRRTTLQTASTGRGGGIRTPKSGFGDRQFNR